MREILFRAKHVVSKEWVYGYYVNFQYPYEKEHHTGHFIVEYPDKVHEIYTSTIGQYTGLKDRNGKMIFEGDIVDMTDEWWDASGPAGHDSPICAVEFDPPTGGFNPFADYDCDCGVYISSSGCEVIGNIYDNKELLKGD